MTCTGLSAAQNPSEFTTFLRLGNEVGDAPASVICPCRCGWEVSVQRLTSRKRTRQGGVTHKERFKRTLMLIETWQEGEELIPSRRRLISLQEISFQIALLLSIIDCITLFIRARFLRRRFYATDKLLFLSSDTLNSGCCACAGLERRNMRSAE